MGLMSSVGAETAAREIVIAIERAREIDDKDEALDYVEQAAKGIEATAKAGWY